VSLERKGQGLEVPMYGSAGLSITTEDVLAADIRIEDPPVGRRDLWRRLSRPRAFGAALHRALATLADNGASDVATLVEEHSVTALRETDIGPYDFDSSIYAQLAHGAAMGDPGMRRELWNVTQHLGAPLFQGAINSSLDAVHDGPLAVLDAGDEHPQVVVHLSSEFFDYHRTERERFLRFVVELSDVLDVRVVCSHLVKRKLQREHEDDLPASVSEAVQSRSTAPAGARARREATVATAHRALEEYDPSSDDYRGWWRMLWTIYETPAERRRQNDLHQDFRIDVGRTTVSKRITALQDVGIVEKVSINGDQHVRLTPAGVVAVEQFLDEYGRPDDVDSAGRSPEDCGRSTGHTEAAGGQTDVGPSTGGSGSERARETRANGVPLSQRSADSSGADVSDPPNCSAGSVYTARVHGEGQDATDDRPATEAAAAVDDRAPDLDRTAPRSDWMDQYRHEATAAIASDGDIVLSDRPTTDRTTPGDQLVSYSEDRDEVLVSIQGDKSVARVGTRLCEALLSEELLRSALTPRKLDGTDVALGGLETDNVYVLHKGRCIGYLKNEEANGKDFHRRLRQARNELSKLAGRLSDDEGNFDETVASTLTSESLGLAGTVISLFDLLDVDVTVEVEFPEYSRNHHSNRDAITQFVSKLARINSRYGHYSAQRILHEPREDKRSDALGAPKVDRKNPEGKSMANWNLAGPGIDRLATPLREALDDPPVDDLQEDAENFAEFVVNIDVVQGWRREAVVDVLSRMANFKNLRATRRVVAMFRALCRSVLDVARAMDTLKGEPNFARDLDLAELRYGLVEGLPRGRILSDAGGSTVSAVVHSLLAVDGWVSTAQLADLADVTEQSVRDNRTQLEGVGLVHVDEGDVGTANQWRLTLPFKSERGQDHDSESGRLPLLSYGTEADAPVPLFSDDGFAEGLNGAVSVMLYRLGRSLCDEENLREAMTWGGDDDPPDVRPVVDHWPELLPWVDILAALSGHGHRVASDDNLPFVGHEAGGWSRFGGLPSGEEWGRGPLRLSSTVGTLPSQRQSGLNEW